MSSQDRQLQKRPIKRFLHSPAKQQVSVLPNIIDQNRRHLVEQPQYVFSASSLSLDVPLHPIANFDAPAAPVLVRNKKGNPEARVIERLVAKPK